MSPDTNAVGPPPVSIAAEQVVLGTILLQPQMIARAMDVLRADDFSEEIHRRVFDVVARLSEEGRTPSLITVLPFIGDHQLFEGVSTQQYLAELCTYYSVGSGSIDDTTRIVRELSLRRQLIDLAKQSIDMASAVGFDVKPETIAAQMISRLDEIAAFGQSNSLRRIGLGTAAQTAFADALEKRSGKPARGVKTGLAALDEMLGALEPGHGSVLAGRPSMGKTAVGLAIAQNVARSGSGVAYVSLEMGGISLAQRALAAECFDDRAKPIPYMRIARGQFSDQEAERIDAAARRLALVPMQIEQQPALLVSQIAARVRQIKVQMAAEGVSLGIVVIDHLGLVGASSRYSGDRVREIGEISAGLHGLAREADTHVMMLCQLNRKVEERQDKRPQLSDLRESGEIEQNADVVMGVFREAYYVERSGHLDEAARGEQIKNEIEVNVLKNRQGPTGSARLFADMACNAIRGLQS
jgi:replicative DNA helicase